MNRSGIKRLSHRAVVVCALVCLGVHSFTLAGVPNFIVILTDDQGYADVGCYGSGSAPNAAPWKAWDHIAISTPRLDKMASEGVRFTSFYSGRQVCSPTRAALLTGCYPDRVEIPGVLFPSAGYGLNPNEITLAELLKARGYATGIFGKWHLGHEPIFLPTRQGFDHYYGVPYSNDMYLDPDARLSSSITLREGWTINQINALKSLSENDLKTQSKDKVPLMRNEEVIEFPADQATLTRRYTDEAIQFIKSNSTRPFLVYVPYTMPHKPLAASTQFAGTTSRGLYGDAIAEIDWNVGRLLDSLKSFGLDQNTLVMYTSDNGPAAGTSDGGTAYPLRGGKHTNWEGGFRVPCIMRWPQKIAAGLVQNEFAAIFDLFPTLAMLSAADNQQLPKGRIIDGRNIWTLMSGAAGAKTPHEAFYYDLGCIRSGNWKFRDTGSTGQLFNLATDIHEDNNVAGQNQSITADLKSKLSAFKTSLNTSARPRGTLETVILKAGCTDKTSVNYEATAQIDDGSCKYTVSTIDPYPMQTSRHGSRIGDISLRFDNVSRTITVEFSHKSGTAADRNVTLRLYDARGSRVKARTPSHYTGDKTVRWDVENLPPGLFVAEVKSNSASYVKALYVK